MDIHLRNIHGFIALRPCIHAFLAYILVSVAEYQRECRALRGENKKITKKAY